MKTSVIAIDGESYVGKSTIAKCLSELIGYTFVNSGHLFRSIAKMCIEKKVSHEDVSSVISFARNMKFDFKNNRGISETVVNGKNWTKKLDEYQYILFASKIAVIPELRNVLLQKLREYAKGSSIVIEGQDIGTVVFPDALWKFFITAKVEIRAKRMMKVMRESLNMSVSDYRDLIPKVRALDYAAVNRKTSPLVIAKNSIVYDNSTSPSESQDALILSRCITCDSDRLHSNKIIYNEELMKVQ